MSGAGPSARVEVVRSGGLGGMTRRASMDASDLDPNDAARIEDLMARWAGPPDVAGARPPRRGADRFCYEVAVTTGEEQRSVSLREEDLAPETRRLLEKLLSGRRRKGG